MPVTPNSIITPQTPKSAVATAALAQSAFPPSTAPSNTVLLITAGSNGARVTRLEGCPQETTTANNLQIYRSTDSGATKYLARQTTLTATVSASVAAANGDFGLSDMNPLILQANERIYVAVGVSKSVNFVAEWADY